MLKSIFEKNSGESERDSELRRLNEAFRECRQASQERVQNEHVPEKMADNVIRIGFVNRNRER